MPNQRDIHFNIFNLKVDEEAGFLLIKQGTKSAYSNELIGPTRDYRIRLTSIIGSYLEGPFGGYDQEGTPHDDCWRLVISAMRCVDGNPLERDVVIHIYKKDQAQEVFDLVTSKLNF